jgi:hypothetical protein
MVMVIKATLIHANSVELDADAISGAIAYNFNVIQIIYLIHTHI